jgi:hypothetical protein
MDTSPIIQNTPPGAPSPKKYIRTFEGDIETFKKGGKPDLVPLEKPSEIKTPTKEIQKSISSQPPAPPQPAPAFRPAGPPPPTPKPEPPLNPVEVRQHSDTVEKPSPIETYSHDFLRRIKETRASTATILAAEQDSAKGGPKSVENISSRGNILYIIAGIVLLILGGSGGYVTYTRYLAKMQPITLAPVISAPIFVNESEKISGASASAILQEIKRSVTRSLAPNTVRFLYTDFATTTNNSVFAALQLPAPGILLRNINSASSMAGIVSAGGSQYPFFVLSVSSYGDTFAGMLSWEPAMGRDLSAIFPPFAESYAVQATSTPTVKLVFRDEIVSNHDVRIYRDREGRSILIYGYWNKKTLIIARNQAAFIEIVERLATARTQL